MKSLIPLTKLALYAAPVLVAATVIPAAVTHSVERVDATDPFILIDRSYPVDAHFSDDLMYTLPAETDATEPMEADITEPTETSPMQTIQPGGSGSPVATAPPATTAPPSDDITDPVLPPIDLGGDIEPIKPTTSTQPAETTPPATTCPPLPDVNPSDDPIIVDPPIHLQPPPSDLSGNLGDVSGGFA